MFALLPSEWVGPVTGVATAGLIVFLGRFVLRALRKPPGQAKPSERRLLEPRNRRLPSDTDEDVERAWK